MNSFASRDATLDVLKAYPDLQRRKLPLDFLRHRVPKIAAGYTAGYRFRMPREPPPPPSESRRLPIFQKREDFLLAQIAPISRHCSI